MVTSDASGKPLNHICLKTHQSTVLRPHVSWCNMWAVAAARSPAASPVNVHPISDMRKSVSQTSITTAGIW